MRIKLGSKVKDIISGYEGIATGCTEWLTGCVQYVVCPTKLDKDGKRQDGEWIDEMRLTVVAAPAKALQRATAARVSDGGPQQYPAARSG